MRDSAVEHDGSSTNHHARRSEATTPGSQGPAPAPKQLDRDCNKSHHDLSRGHFIRAFQQSVGETPHRWLTTQKIEKARRLLRETGQPLTEIALACGFCDQAHFTRTFSRVSGTTPGAWRHNRI